MVNVTHDRYHWWTSSLLTTRLFCRNQQVIFCLRTGGTQLRQAVFQRNASQTNVSQTNAIQADEPRKSLKKQKKSKKALR